jgi:HK97 family phage major capsid protein
VLSPSDWQEIRLLTDTAGQFFGGGPFGGQYGGPQGPVAPFVGASLWGIPVALSSTVGSGTALIGAFGQATQLWRRGGVSVEATNSNEDDFLHDLVAIRAESRAALAVYRPSALCEVRF